MAEENSNVLDRAITYVSPSWGRKRAASRVAVNALYEAGVPSRVRRNKTRPESGDIAVARAGTRIRDNARYLEQNLDIAKGALDVLEANIVGTGVRPEPGVMTLAGEPAEELNLQISALFKHWSKSPEVTGEMNLAQYQKLVVRSTLRDGDLFTRTITGSTGGLTRRVSVGGKMQDVGVPFWLQGLEADFVDLQNTKADQGIYQGIKLDQWQRPISYEIYPNHPSGLVQAGQMISVPAEQMIHSKMIQRFGQIRGVSLFAHVINRLDDIKEIDETERVAARVAAAMAAYIKKGSPDNYDSENGGEYRNMDIAPGMIFDDLDEGEEIGTISSNRPNNALIPFRDAQLRSAAAGLGVSYSSLSKNYNGTYSAQRQELVEQYGSYGILWSYFANHSFQRIYEQFINAAISARLLNVSGVDMLTLYACTHSRPPLVWIDPVKEVKANKELRDNNWKSDGQIIRDRGDDPAETWKQIQRDAEAQKTAGIVTDDETTNPVPTE